MLTRKQSKPLALMAIFFIVAMTAAGQATEKRRKRILWLGGDDPYIFFVAGQPFLVAAERGRSALLLHYPDLEIVRKLDGPVNQTVESIKTSPSGKWLAVSFHGSSFKVEGALRLWNTATGEPGLSLDDASMTYEFHPSQERMVVWQPKGGITQWSLDASEAKRVGPTIPMSVDRANLSLSSDGRYALVKGSCQDDKLSWDLCVVNLEDGSLVARTIIIDKISRQSAVEANLEFLEILEAAKLPHVLKDALRVDDTSAERSGFHVTGYTECKELGNHQLCYSGQEVSGSSPGHPRWKIHPRDDLEARMVTSFAASADGHWIALGIDGVSVLLFDTEQIDPTGKPTMVKRFEMP